MDIKLSEHFTYGKIIRYSLPNIGTMLAITSFQMIDGFFVSNWLGVFPFAAINLVFPLIMVCASPGFMIGAGGSAIIAKMKGENNWQKAREYFTMLFVTLLLGGLLFGTAMYFFLPEILDLLGASEELKPYCLEFGRLVFFFLPCVLISSAFQSLWVAAEKPILGFRLSLLQGGTVILGDWLLIVQMDWGIEGAAIATSLGTLFFSVLTFIYFARKNASGLHFVKFDPEWRTLGHICYNGSSEMVDAVSANIVEILMNLQLMYLIGEIGVVAIGVYSYVNEIFLAIFFALSTTTVTIVGYKYGANDWAEITSVLKKNIILTLGFGVVLTLSAIFFSEEIAQLYVGYDVETKELTIKALRICSLTFLLYGFNVFTSSFFTGLEKSFLSAVIAFLQSLIMPAMFIFLLPEIFGVDAIWFSLPVATLITSFFAAFFLIKKYWR